MIKQTITTLGFIILSLGSAQAGAISQAQKTATGVIFQTTDGELRLEPRTDHAIHVTFGAAGFDGNYNPAVILKPSIVAFGLTEDKDAFYLTTSALKIKVLRHDSRLVFMTPKDQVIAEEGLRDLSKGVTQAFRTEALYYGLGQHQNGLLDYANTTIHLQQANRDVGVPVIVSSKGFGLIWNNASVTDVDVNQSAQIYPLIFRSEGGAKASGVDYEFLYGPEMDDIIGQYRTLTGDAPLMARWVWGMWQSKERYKTQDELLGVAQKYRDLGIPIDAVVQDWQYWRSGQWGSHQMDKDRFPDPAKMVKTLHDQNLHAVISVWPRFDVTSENTAEMDQVGGLFPIVYPNVYPAGQGRWYDAYNPKARALYWQQIMKNAGINGWDGWWLDASEAELGGNWGEMRTVQTASGSGRDVYNAYPLVHTTAVYDGMMRDQATKRPIILTRSAYTGQQRNAAITWSGDITGDWDTLKRQVPAALNFSLSGIPYWSSDIGGFFGGKPSDPNYAELFTRWYQFGVFNPMFRVHGTGAGKELWNFDAATQKILIDYDRLRYQLLPYIYATSWQVTQNQSTMMRAMVFDYRQDPYAIRLTDQYMFGPSLLVAPVSQPKASTRTVYLPGSQDWFDFWTGARFAPKQTVTAKADISTIPVFVKAGAILPLGPVKSYADAPSSEPIVLSVYPGADGTYLYYDDAGDGHDYRTGQFATFGLGWNNASKNLTLSDRKGRYKSMPSQIAFVVQCRNDKASRKAIRYTGKSMMVEMPSCQ